MWTPGDWTIHSQGCCDQLPQTWWFKRPGKRSLSQLGRLAGQCLLLVGALATALLLIVAQLQSLPQSPHGLLPWASCSYQDSRHIG